jgi:hypothetical protein
METVMQSGTAFEVDRNAGPTVRALAIVWRAVCAPVHALLALLEPIVSFVLGLLALLGICISLVFEIVRPQFPFWTMMSISISFLLALLLYHLLLRLTAGR